jgi:hypothetical protein
MRTFLQSLLEAARRLAGPGALDNAASELQRATRSTIELDRQLDRVRLDLPPRRAA